MDIENIKWWIEDNWKTLVGMLFVFGILFITFLVFKMERDSERDIPAGYEGQIVLLKENEEELKETFSLLDQFDTVMNDSELVYEIDLYNKKPFIERKDIELILNKYIEGLKIVTETKDQTIRAVKFRIYDRKTKYDEGIRPDGIYYYAIPYLRLPDTEKEDKDSKYYLLSPNEVAFEYTSNTAPKGLKLDEHQLFGEYNELRRKPGVTPLTDQEFDWYVKLEHYLLLGADSGSLYLEWELGAPKNSSATRLFRNDVIDFKKRVTSLGGDQTIFGDDSLRKVDVERRLVIENPSFLWYVESDEIVEDAIEARSLLVKEYPDKYQDTVEKWVESLAEEQIRKMEQGIDPGQDGLGIDGSSRDDTGEGVDSLDSIDEESDEEKVIEPSQEEGLESSEEQGNSESKEEGKPVF